MDSGQQREPHSSTNENIRLLEDSTMPGDTDIQDDKNHTRANMEDTPTGGLHKPRQPPSQGVYDTLKELKLANQGNSSEQPAD